MNRSEKELRPFRPAHRIFDPPVDKRSPGKRQSRATPIPASYVYSPSLVPRPPDWPSHVQASMLRSADNVTCSLGHSQFSSVSQCHCPSERGPSISARMQHIGNPADAKS